MSSNSARSDSVFVLQFEGNRPKLALAGYAGHGAFSMVMNIEANEQAHGSDPEMGEDDDTRIITPDSDNSATRLIPGRGAPDARPTHQETEPDAPHASHDATSPGQSSETKPPKSDREPDSGGSSPRGKVIGVAPAATVADRASSLQARLSEAAPEEEDDQTVILPAAKASASTQSDVQPEISEQIVQTKFDPPVGWLVIREGPGRGSYRPVFYGQNAIGRSATQRINLDFGDLRISREEHAFLIYDEISRRFYLRDNGKTNLVRINGVPVMAPTEIYHQDQITIGSTQLLFVALCGHGFDWLADEATHSDTGDNEARASGHEPTSD